MSETPFGHILEQVVSQLPGAKGAIFVDWEGEAVDAHSCIGRTDLRFIGAYWAIPYFQARAILAKQDLGTLTEMTIRFEKQQVVIRRVTDEYLILLALGTEASLGRALSLLRWAGEKIRELM
jgi:predicted regulator of Ras-like GTPase activity (Roadblock/LC7/MglB family)